MTIYFEFSNYWTLNQESTVSPFLCFVTVKVAIYMMVIRFEFVSN